MPGGFADQVDIVLAVFTRHLHGGVCTALLVLVESAAWPKQHWLCERADRHLAHKMLEANTPPTRLRHHPGVRLPLRTGRHPCEPTS